MDVQKTAPTEANLPTNSKPTSRGNKENHKPLILRD
ncbi:hypothetical protein P780_16090 [Vibrio mimicus CAIM 1882]|nr:hypothetical protein P780_16090 [Vibrio mimicus CAIM 1882]